MSKRGVCLKMKKLFLTGFLLAIVFLIAACNCTDSDGGLDYDVKGLTERGTDSFLDRCLLNGEEVYECEGEDCVLEEGHCDGAQVSTIEHSCFGDVCRDGACRGDCEEGWTCVDYRTRVLVNTTCAFLETEDCGQAPVIYPPAEPTCINDTCIGR